MARVNTKIGQSYPTSSPKAQMRLIKTRKGAFGIQIHGRQRPNLPGQYAFSKVFWFGTNGREAFRQAYALRSKRLDVLAFVKGECYVKVAKTPEAPRAPKVEAFETLL